MLVELQKVKDLSLKHLDKDTAPFMEKVALFAESAIQKNIESNIPPANAPLTVALKNGSKTLKGKSGTLRQLHSSYNKTTATVTSPAPYARIQNEGGTILPKNAKYLCVPARADIQKLTKEMKGVRNALKTLEGLGYVIYRPYKRGSSTMRANVIMGKKKNGKPELLFILKKSITIPKREFMKLSKRQLAYIDKMAEAYFGQA